ncbi:MAG: UvrD-helicase domain-containing protein, partial [Methanomicrobium sp.]|nr:UvrD-helicase domain-containing protein [Methanomicrobium sp.]
AILKELGKIVYKYPILQALKDGIIPEFSWVVHPVYLDIKEQAEFSEISRQIQQLFNYVRNDKDTILNIINKRGFTIKGLGDFIYLTDRARLNGKALPDQWKALQALVLKRRQIIHTSQPRLEKAIELAKELGNKHKVVLFLMNIESCDIVGRELKKYLDNVFVIHSQIKERPIDIVNKFIAAETGILIGADMLNEGIDIKSADIGINVAFTKSKLQLIQRMGRVLRKDGEKKPTFYQFVAIPERSFYVEEMDAELFIDDLAWVQSSALQMGLDLNIEWKDSELADYQVEAERFFRVSNENNEFPGKTGTFNLKSALEEFSYTAVRRIPEILKLYPEEDLSDKQWENILKTAHARVTDGNQIEEVKILNLSRAWYILILCGRSPSKLTELFINALKTIEREDSEYIPLPEMALNNDGMIFFPGDVSNKINPIAEENHENIIKPTNSKNSFIESLKVPLIKKVFSFQKDTEETATLLKTNDTSVSQARSGSNKIPDPASRIIVPLLSKDTVTSPVNQDLPRSLIESENKYLPEISPVNNQESDSIVLVKNCSDVEAKVTSTNKKVSEIFSQQNIGNITEDKVNRFLRRLRKDLGAESVKKMQIGPPTLQNVDNISEAENLPVRISVADITTDAGSREEILQITSGMNTDVEISGEENRVSSGFPDIHQKEIIETAPEERIIVDAGPGTGKTAVACARVAWLIDKGGVNPVNVWLVSFTRTAVKEIQNRISEYLKNPDDVHSIRIATLDSHAWKIHSGFDDAASLTGSYEDTIEKLTKKISENKDEAEFIHDQIKHLIIDEAQDIVGPRSKLILSIIDHMNKDAGISVFSDDAQAIYGFSEDNDDIISDKSTLPEELRIIYSGLFIEKKLEMIHRTRSPSLKYIFTNTRKKVLDQNSDINKLNEVKQDILQNSEKISGKLIKNFEDDDCFVLFRKRAEVLRESSYLNIPHRLRMSGLPVCIYPWIGISFNDFIEDKIKKNEFIEIWDERISGTPYEISNSEKSWEGLCRFAGESKTRVNMMDLRTTLGAQHPPAEICYPEFGSSGPVLSTIHASKGRESKEVRFNLIANPSSQSEKTDSDEEARILFVAATRAKERLLHRVGNDISAFNSGKGNQRAFCRVNFKKNALQMQIGLLNDITSECIAGRSYYSSPEEVERNISKIICNSKGMTDAFAWRDDKSNYLYRVVIGESEGLKIWEMDSSDLDDLRQKSPLSLARVVSDDIFIGRKRLNGNYKSTPSLLNHLRIFGLRTIVVPPENSIEETLHYPWCESGFMPAPIISGFPTIYFN